jgi:hypothetical protein
VAGEQGLFKNRLSYFMLVYKSRALM